MAGGKMGDGKGSWLTEGECQPPDGAGEKERPRDKWMDSERGLQLSSPQNKVSSNAIICLNEC